MESFGNKPEIQKPDQKDTDDKNDMGKDYSDFVEIQYGWSDDSDSGTDSHGFQNGNKASISSLSEAIEKIEKMLSGISNRWL